MYTIINPMTLLVIFTNHSENFALMLFMLSFAVCQTGETELSAVLYFFSNLFFGKLIIVTLPIYLIYVVFSIN